MLAMPNANGLYHKMHLKLNSLQLSRNLNTNIHACMHADPSGPQMTKHSTLLSFCHGRANVENVSTFKYTGPCRVRFSEMGDWDTQTHTLKAGATL
jgi:hypothetical protein